MPVSSDHEGMSCGEWITAISAEADGEDPGVDPRLLAAHLETCASCRSYRDQVAGLRRASAVAPADEMPDLSRNVAKLNAVADRASHWWVVRGLLGLVAVIILVVSLPALLGEEGPSVHESRHVGAFSIAYAAALLLVVIRRARAIFPVTLVLAACCSSPQWSTSSRATCRWSTRPPPPRAVERAARVAAGPAVPDPEGGDGGQPDGTLDCGCSTGRHRRRRRHVARGRLRPVGNPGPPRATRYP